MASTAPGLDVIEPESELSCNLVDFYAGDTGDRDQAGAVGRHRRSRDSEEVTELTMNLIGIKARKVSTRATKIKDRRGAACSEAEETNDIFSEPSPDLQKVFQWNKHFADVFQSGGYVCESGDAPRSLRVFGHSEFAGGGAAEIAANCVSAAFPGKVFVDVRTQGDWDNTKMKSLQQNFPQSCKFKDIMGIVDAKGLDDLPCEAVVLKQFDILSALGLARCRIPDEDEPHPPSHSTFSENSERASASQESSSQVASRSSSSSKSSSTSSASCPPAQSSGSQSVPMIFQDSTDESLVDDPNDCALISEESLEVRLAGMFDKAHRLKHQVGGADEGWIMFGAQLEEEDAAPSCLSSFDFEL